MSASTDNRDLPPVPAVNRRGFLGGLAKLVSGGFVLGTTGGIAVGAIGPRNYDRRQGIIGQTSYAQQGEDLILWNMCEFLKIRQPTYLDIGAYDPIEINNTYLFYTRGCRGVLVEPNPALWHRLESV